MKRQSWIIQWALNAKKILKTEAGGDVTGDVTHEGEGNVKSEHRDMKMLA